jgi:hypothetical protein
MRNDPNSLASSPDEVNIRIVSTSFTSVCADRWAVRIIASPGSLCGYWMITTSLKRAAELRLITCCYLGASGYEGIWCDYVCCEFGVVDEGEEETNWVSCSRR